MRLKRHTRGHTPVQLPWHPLARPHGRYGRTCGFSQPSQPTTRLHSRRLQHSRSWQQQPWRQRSTNALSSSPRSQLAILLAGSSIVVATGEMYLILGH